MSKTREPFTSPVGRIVQGDVFVAQTKDQQGNLRVHKSGPNIGQPAPQFFVALAIPKLNPANPAEWNPEWLPFMAMLHRIAVQEWPSLFNAATPDANLFGILAKPSVNPLFTFKVKDGDGLDRNGKNNADKEGFPGHWIVSFASSYAPKVVRPTSPGVWETLTDPATVKRGFYGRIAGSVTGNDSPNTPGLYVNLDMFELLGYGAEIVGGPDAATAFAAPVALPPGASAIPVGGAAMPPPAGAATPPVPGAPASPPVVPAAAGVIPSPAAASPVPASPPVAGYTGYMGVPGAEAGAPAVPLASGAPVAASPSPPPVPPSVPAATASPSRAMTAKANGQTYESFVAAGWTDALLIEHGYVTA